MNYNCFAIFILLQVFSVEWTESRHLSLLHLSDSLSGRTSLLDFSKNGIRRGRRCLSSTLSLLWPQVVGPVEQGLIEESDYNSVPKTPLEYRLDLLRKKAEEEEYDRLVVRSYLKKLTEAQDEFYGYSVPNDYT